MLSNGQIGNISETKALLAAQERGWHVFTTQGNSCHYDLIYDVEGTLLRVQVKTAGLRKTKDGNLTLTVTVRRNDGKNKNHKAYEPNDFDFLVTVYQKEFWVIPMQEVAGRTGISLGPTATQYRNAWHLIEQEADRRSRAAMAGAAEMDSIAEHYSQPGAM